MGRAIDDIIAFLQSLTKAIAGALRRNLGLAVLSVGLAITLWVFVTDTESTARSGVLPLDIPVEVVNVPADVAIAEIRPSEVQVRVDVREDVWDSLTVEDFEATADLLNLPEGAHQVSVEVKPLRSPGNLRVTQVIPEPVEVVLQPLFSKSVPVVIDTQGSPQAGYEIAEPVPEIDEVIVSGPDELVSLVRTVSATVDVGGASRDVDRAFRLLARDARQQRVEGVIVEPSVINIRLPVQLVVSEVLVAPTIEGAPASGYSVTGFSVNPTVVTVIESEGAPPNLRVLPTRIVDIDGVRADVVQTVALDLPLGVSVAGSAEVEVRVRIEPVLGELPFLVALQVEGLVPGLQVGGTLPTIEVILSGELPDLRSVGSRDVEAFLDFSGLAGGTHTVGVEIQPPQSLSVISVTPDEIEVTLEAVP